MALHHRSTPLPLAALPSSSLAARGAAFLRPRRSPRRLPLPSPPPGTRLADPSRLGLGAADLPPVALPGPRCENEKAGFISIVSCYLRG
uniref:Uncharacterized protein n=1 Tax=Leersia perrieri TaxID=77586 RepID=A0A0D9X715_9ORYZ